jgi:hypothetical protein
MSRVSEAELKGFAEKVAKGIPAAEAAAILNTVVIEGEPITLGDPVKVLSGSLLFSMPLTAVLTFSYSKADGGVFHVRVRVRKDAHLTMEAAIDAEDVGGLLTGDTFLQVRKSGVHTLGGFCDCTECICHFCDCGPFFSGGRGQSSKQFRQNTD